MALKKIAIMMSTYNGEKYLKEQLDSIFKQEGVEVSLFIRDDQSRDKTLSVIDAYRSQVHLLSSESNLGVGNSFMTLVYEVGNQFDYYAFADQDDIWLADKLSSAIGQIEEISSPALYCSNQMLVDQDLRPLKERHCGTIDVSYSQILNSNLVTGCTMVWNKELQQLLSSPARRPSEELLTVRIHDVWVAMVASLLGQIVYDKTPHILYRQHEHNVVGVRKENLFKIWSKKLKDNSKRNGRSRLSKEILLHFEDLLPDTIINELDLIATYSSSIKKKLKLLFSHHILSKSSESSIGIFVKILFNLI